MSRRLLTAPTGYKIMNSTKYIQLKLVPFSLEVQSKLRIILIVHAYNAIYGLTSIYNYVFALQLLTQWNILAYNIVGFDGKSSK